MFKRFFGRKKPEPKALPNISHLPALNEWDMFFQGQGISLYSRFAGSLPDGRQYVYLKSFPEVFSLERGLFGDWLYPTDKGVYLQQLADTTGNSCALVFISYDAEATILKQGITSTDWATGYEGGLPVILFGNGEHFIAR